METIVSGTFRNPIIPKVQIIPRNTTGSGRRGRLTCLKTRKRATTIKRPEITRSVPMEVFISRSISSPRATSPVTIVSAPAGNSAIATAERATGRTALILSWGM